MKRGRWVVCWSYGQAKRFSSLSRARRFAREVEGRVFRYKRRDFERLAPWVTLE